VTAGQAEETPTRLASRSSTIRLEIDDESCPIFRRR
jgi:hypothetical protein